jgi:hypothetical protein
MIPGNVFGNLHFTHLKIFSDVRAFFLQGIFKSLDESQLEEIAPQRITASREAFYRWPNI